MKQLSGMDAGFIHLEKNRNRFQVGSLLFYDVSTAKNSFVRFKDILHTFETRIHRNSILRKKIQRVPFNLDHPYWVDDSEFDIEHHVRHIALPKPGDWRQLCILVARIHARPLDFGKPLWETYIIEGLDNIEGVPKGAFALYVKLHHASIDGIAGNDLITSIHDQEPFPKKPAKHLHEDSYHKGSPSTVEMLVRAYTSLLKQPMRVFDLAQTAVPAWSRIRKAKEEKLFTPLGPSEHTRFNDHISGNLVMDAAIFDFEEMRKIKNSVPDVTINDVMLALVSGAMVKYLNSKGEKPRRDLSAGMPINIRPYLKDVANQDSSNLVSVAKVSLQNHVKDPLERLKAIHKSATESKAYQNAMGVRVMLEVGRSMPALLTSLAARAVPTIMTMGDEPVINTIVTNVPGSQTPLYMCGAKLAGMCNIGILVDGLGIFHAVSSYCGTATVSFQACRKMMPDPEYYKECIIESFEELKEAAEKRHNTQNEAEKPQPGAPPKKRVTRKAGLKKKVAAKKPARKTALKNSSL